MAESSSIPFAVHGVPAPYGRACTNCSRVKSKCIYRTDGSSCERCYRLRKDCQTPVSIRKRNYKKNGGSKTAQLEGKLDHLECLLRPQQVEQQVLPEPSFIEYSDAPLNLERLHLNGDCDSDLSKSSLFDSPMSFPPYILPAPGNVPIDSSVGQSPSSVDDEVSVHRIPDEAAEKQLDTFCRAFLPFFPFIHIPAQMSAADLRIQKPFLWLVIMSLTTRSVEEQRAMGETILKIVSQKVVAEHEKNMDILLGLICYLAWFQYHKKDKLYLIMWTQLAVALVFELGIHKPARTNDGQLHVKYSWLPPRWPASPVSHTRTSEERRAVLAVFLLTSMIWTSLRQIEPLRWTASMDDYVRVLSEEKEAELDVLLVTQARCQVIANQITSYPTERALGCEDFKTPPASFVKAIQLQLQDIRKSLPVGVQSNRSALLCMYGMEVIINEALLKRKKVRDQTGLSDLQRLEGLDSILTAIEQWIAVFFDVPLIDWIGITYAILAQFSHCAILLFKLTSLDEPDWDLNDVIKRADLLDILERLAQHLDSIPPLLGLIDSNDPEDTGIFFKSSRLIRGLKATFAAELAQNPLQMGLQRSLYLGPAEFPGESFGHEDIHMSFGDDPWWNELLLVQGTSEL